MAELISVCMATHNRKRQLLNSLWSIEHTNTHPHIEVIVIDDNSTEWPSDRQLSKYSFPLNYEYIYGHTRQEPVIPNNMAFNKAKGDKIIMSCGEIAFMGDIIGHVHKYLDDTKYLVYSTYAINEILYKKICKFRWNHPSVMDKAREAISPLVEIAEYKTQDHNGWYYHPVHKPLALPFCASLSKKNMDLISGYDERLQYGVGHADNDMVRRIIQAGLKIEGISGLYVIHQPHEKTDYSNLELVKLNLQVADQLNALKTVKADQNKIFRR